MVYDTGFAPNPFWEYCTLATCKPRIRRRAEVGDWIIGTGSVRNIGQNKLVYAMKVTETMTLEDYGSDSRFRKKIPSKGTKQEIGDNIYYRDKDGYVRQRFPSLHSYPIGENPEIKRHDLSGKNVLISRSGNFYYFGRKGPAIPEQLSCLTKKGPGCKCNFSQHVIDRFLRWIEGKTSGINGDPCDYPTPRKGCIKPKRAKRDHASRFRG